MAAIATKVINFRAPAVKQALIDHAAQVVGKNRTDFILDASCEKALEILADQTRFSLGADDMKRFNDLLDTPPANMDALRKLLQKPSPWES